MEKKNLDIFQTSQNYRQNDGYYFDTSQSMHKALAKQMIGHL